MNAVCAAKILNCELQNIPYDGIFAALDSGKINVIAAGMNITDERKQKYGMPGPYLKSALAFMTLEGSNIDGTLATLRGQTVGTVGASVFESYLTETMGAELTLNTYDSMYAAVLDLDAGRLVAVLGELAQLQPAYVSVRPDAYLRREQGGALLGLYDTHDALAKWRDGCPVDSENELFEPDYDRIMPWLENALGAIRA